MARKINRATAASKGQAPMLDTGRSFFKGGQGRWAGERLMAAIKANRPISPKELRTLDLLNTEEWKLFDTEVVAGARTRLRGVADLIAAGLVKTISNGLAITVFEYGKIGDMDDAIVSLDGVTRSENDRLEFEMAGLPLPITHKDWYLNLRLLLASRRNGEPLDTTYSRVAGTKCGEMTEEMLFNGGKTFGGRTIYGYTTFPDRMTESFGTNGAWHQSAKTGDNIVADVGTMVSAMEAAGQYGPWWIYVPGNASLKLGEDYKTASDKTIRQRLLEMDGIQAIRVVDKLASGNVVMVQPSPETVQMVEGERLQTIQWDIEGGFQINFKAFQIMVPLLKSDSEGNSGLVHMA